jgi:hypothetical protein
MFNNLQAIYIILALFVLMSVHIFFPQFERVLTRRWPNWVSTSGGLAVGYVFIYLLPKLTVAANHTVDKFPNFPLLSITIIYFFMLLGFVSYWIIDLYSSEDHPLSHHWRKLQSFSFFIYNMLIGHLFVSATHMEPLAYLLATFVMALHLAGLNHQYKMWHPDFFVRVLRWLMPLGIIVGAVGGAEALLPRWVVNPFTAYVGGAILINVVYYELPRSRGVRVKAFLVGVVLFAVINLMIRYMRSGSPQILLSGITG